MNFSANFSMSSLFAGFVFGVFGYFFFRDGKKKANFVMMLVGLALMIFPYFVENIYLTWAIGLGLITMKFVLGK